MNSENSRIKINENLYENTKELQTADKAKMSITDVYENFPSAPIRSTADSKGCRLTAVCLGVLCVLLLVGITVLGVKFASERHQFSELVEHNKQGRRYFSSRMYYLTSQKTTWNESRDDCRKRGADLVIINSIEKQEFINNNFGNGLTWIGLTDNETENIWKWVDGTTLSNGTGYWSKGEPNDNGGNEDCVVTGWGSSDIRNSWNDLNCDGQTFGLCEKIMSNHGYL